MEFSKLNFLLHFSKTYISVKWLFGQLNSHGSISTSTVFQSILYRIVRLVVVVVVEYKSDYINSLFYIYTEDKVHISHGSGQGPAFLSNCILSHFPICHL